MATSTPAPLQDQLSAAFVRRCKAFPSGSYPGNAALYRAMQMSAAEFRKCLAGRASFTRAQLEAGNLVLRGASPFDARRWISER